MEVKEITINRVIPLRAYESIHLMATAQLGENEDPSDKFAELDALVLKGYQKICSSHDA